MQKSLFFSPPFFSDFSLISSFPPVPFPPFFRENHSPFPPLTIVHVIGTVTRYLGNAYFFFFPRLFAILFFLSLRRNSPRLSKRRTPRFFRPFPPPPLMLFLFFLDNQRSDLDLFSYYRSLFLKKKALSFPLTFQVKFSFYLRLP